MNSEHDDWHRQERRRQARSNEDSTMLKGSKERWKAENETQEETRPREI